MNDLSRSLLAAAREGLEPDAAAAARVRAKVAAAIAGAGATGATGAAAVIPAPAKAARTSALLKVGAALVTAGVVATLLVIAIPHRTPEPPRLSVPAADLEHDELRTEIRVAASSDASGASDADAPEIAPAARPPIRRAPLPAPAEPEPAARATEPATPAPTDATPLVEPATLSREVELIDLAMVSLRKNAPRAAIEAIRVFDRETFGHGQMAEDAAAIAIEAHCRLHEDVTDALADFDRTWPSSAQRERIQTSCFGHR